MGQGAACEPAWIQQRARLTAPLPDPTVPGRHGGERASSSAANQSRSGRADVSGFMLVMPDTGHLGIVTV